MIEHIYPYSDPKNGIFRYGKLLDKIIDSVRADYNNKNIYHVELGYGSHKELWSALRIKKDPSVRIVLTLHDPPIIVGKPFEHFISGNNVITKLVRKTLDISIGQYVIRRVISRADALIVLNHKAISLVANKFNINEDKIFYSPLPPLLKPASLNTEQKTDNSILFFGNVSSRKGVELLVGAFKNISPKLNKYHLVITGGYDKNEAYFKRLKLYASDPAVQDKIKFTGFVGDKSLGYLISKASIVVLPYYDPGIVHASGPLITSMAAGKAVIASDIPVFSDTIKNEQTGLLFPEGSKHILEKQITLLLSDGIKRAEIAKNAKEYIGLHNNVDMIKKSLIKVYNSL